MKKGIAVVIMLLILLAANGCKKNEGVSLPVRISFFNINPQVIDDDETALICISVSNLEQNIVLIKTMADHGITNPSITYTTGNPVYIEYFPPSLQNGEEREIIVTVIVSDIGGKELDRADGRIFVHD